MIAATPRLTDRLPRYLLLWLLCFLISIGLGYPGLRRYDPRKIDSLSDTALYYQLVVNNPRNLGRENMRGRLLIPLVARPFAWLARGHSGSVDPILLGLLIANAIFCALTATILASVAAGIVADRSVAVLAAMLYLLSFAVSNFYLVGLVDSAEACLLILMTWLLRSHKWRWLPLLGLIGVITKETFAPLAGMFALGWWYASGPRQLNWVNAAWIAGFLLTSFVGMTVLQSTLAGRLFWPWELAVHVYSGANFLGALINIFATPSFWYFFVWALPLGIWRLPMLPRAWLIAGASGTVTAVLMGAWKDVGPNTARPIFNVVGPMLMLSVAIFMAGRSAIKAES